MAKAKKKAARATTRLEPETFGIDLQAILAEIREHLEGTQQQIADAAGIRQAYVAELFTGRKRPSLAALAALARAAGGQLEVKFKPPRRRTRASAATPKGGHG